MSTISSLSLRAALTDPVLRESLLASAVVIVFSGALALALVWVWVLIMAVRAKRQAAVDWLIVPGHVLENEQPSLIYCQRLGHAADLAELSAGVGLLLTGGGQPPEARIGRAWLIEHRGLNPARLLIEEASTDTFENLRQARELLPPTAHAGIVSSRFHLARVQLFARQLGLATTALAAEPRFELTLANLVATLRESVFLCWFLCGSLWARLARREHLLARLR